MTIFYKLNLGRIRPKYIHYSVLLNYFYYIIFIIIYKFLFANNLYYIND